MAARQLPRPNEQTRLLGDDGAANNGPAQSSPRRSSPDSSRPSSGFLSPRLQKRHDAARLTTRVLPVAFVGGFGIAGTVAAIMFVYSYLICTNQARCDASEKETYAKTVAAATTVTNILSVLLLGPVQFVGRWKRQAGLVLWLLARGSSLLFFLLAIAFKSLVFAFVAQALEGASTDGLLHFNLNAAYVENAPDAEAPRLFGLSLGLFMLGLAVGPAITGQFADPRWGFYIGTAAFTAALVYVLSPFVPWPQKKLPADECAIEEDLHEWSRRQTGDVAVSTDEAISGLASVVQPLLFFWSHPGTILHGLSLLAFTSGQGFFFPALLIHAITNFAFDGQQVSVMVTTLAVATSLNLLTIVVVLPFILTHLYTHLPPLRRVRDFLTHRTSWDTAWACWSILIFSIAVLLLLGVRAGWQLYVVAIFCSCGNATPPFVKSHLSRRLRKDDKAMALAALALCETTGSLLSPLLIGAAQARGAKAGWPVFAVVTSGLLGCAGVLFSAAAWAGCPPILEDVVVSGREDGLRD